MSALFSPIDLGGLPFCQPHRRGADVPVFGRRWLGDRLAPPALDDARHVGCRLGHHGGDRRRARGPHHPWLPRPLQRRQRGRRQAHPRRGRARSPARHSFGIQLAHAGRKASTKRPWEGGGPLGADEDPWPTVAPSAVAFDEGWNVPEALDHAGIDRVLRAFVDAAARAHRAGFDFVEIHGAHGYLLHEFLSPLTNRRTDDYGGTLENRMRLIVSVARAHPRLAAAGDDGRRAALGDRLGRGRLHARRGRRGGARRSSRKASPISAPRAAACARTRRSRSRPATRCPSPKRIRREAGIPTRAVGLIDEPYQAEAIVAEGRADMVALARAMLADPRWPWRAAATLGAAFHPPPQYLRSKPTMEKWVVSPEAEEERGLGSRVPWQG